MECDQSCDHHVTKMLTKDEWQAIAILRSVANIALAGGNVPTGVNILALPGRVQDAVDVANRLLRRTAGATMGDALAELADDAAQTAVSPADWRPASNPGAKQVSDPKQPTAYAVVTVGLQLRPQDCPRANCSGALLHNGAQMIAACGLSGCRHNWNATHGGCGQDQDAVLAIYAQPRGSV